LNTHFETIYKIGYQILDVPGDIFSSIKAEVNKMESNNFVNNIPHNKYLVGNIEREYMITESVPQLEILINDAAHQYMESYGIPSTPRRKYKFLITPNPGTPAVWVNFQKKHEFNPIHDHIGLLSFVIFVKIPYYLSEENKNPSSVNSSAPRAGVLAFHYVDQYAHGGVSTHNLSIDKSFEGKMIIFSSGLKHSVTPFFTSEEYRITISGNIILDNL
jgi:hypothetical protein